MATLGPDTIIPANEHRICVIVMSQVVPFETIYVAASNVGVQVSFLTRVDDVKGVDAPYQTYACWIEPAYFGTTATILRDALGALVVLVNEESADVLTEFSYDYTDWYFQEEAQPAMWLSGSEILPQESVFSGYGVWPDIAPPDEVINDTLSQAGMWYINPGSFEGAVEPLDPKAKRLLIGTGKKPRNPIEIQGILGLTQIWINAYPVKGDYETLALIAKHGDVYDSVVAVGAEAQNATIALADTASEALKVGQTGLDIGQVLLWVALFGGLGLLVTVGGIKGYKYFKEQTA
jgi:hypothetical protein